MMKLIILLISLFIPLVQQPNYNLIYDERLQNKSGQIQEQTLTIIVNIKEPNYEMLIKDRQGKNNYKLMCSPIYGNFQSKPLIAWNLYLEKKTFFGWKDVFSVGLKDIADSIEEEDAIGWLFPAADKSIMGENARQSLAPLLFAKRVVKVEQFYCIFDVKDFKFSNKQIGSLESMEINVILTNQYTGPKKRVYGAE